MLRWSEVPEPTGRPGDVLIEVAAVALNRADLLQRQGFYDPPPGASPYLGLECAGVVAAVGEEVEEWQVGDEVSALLTGGGYAERVAVPAAQVLPVPDGLSLIEAAALPEAACTVWSNVFMLGGFRPDEVVLVHGGAGGIGSFAIQLVREFGAKVITTAGNAIKLERCRSLGADVAIDYKSADFVAETKTATDGRGADVILDNIGAAYLDRNLDALATNGRLLVIGLQRGRRAELDLGKLMGKRAAILATTVRARPAEERAAIVRSVREHVWPLIESGKIEPVVDRVLPITEAAEAHRVMAAGEHIGKIILAVA